MKKTLVLAFAVSLASISFAQSNNEVKVKKGKCTISEEYFTELVAKANRLEKVEKELAETNKKLRENSSTELSTFNDSASYAIGCDMFDSWNRQQLGINVFATAQALKDCAMNTNHLSYNARMSLLQRFQQEFEKRQRSGIDENIAAGKKFLAENGNNKSVYTLPSGLQYRILKSGNGKKPKATDRVKVHYTGTLIDGTKFDSSYDRGTPIEFPLQQVIPGWTEGLQYMDEGSKYMLYIPYNLAYGEQEAGMIPGGSTLIFEVELLEILK